MNSLSNIVNGNIVSIILPLKKYQNKLTHETTKYSSNDSK